MEKSATQLGGKHSLSAQEMNYILAKQGFQKGEPGDYEPTEKGRQYAHRTGHHRGPGGYQIYNRDWITTKWDESIEEELDLSEEVKAEARAAVVERRKQLRAEQRAASEAYWAAHSPTPADASEQNQQDSEPLASDEIYGIIGFGLVIVAGIKWAVPHVKTLWNEKVVPRFETRKVQCPKCCKVIRYDVQKKCWFCKDCGKSYQIKTTKK